jgi:hypothetical protein
VPRRTCRKGDEDEEAVTDVEQLLADAIVRVRVLHAAANESERRIVQVRNDLNPPESGLLKDLRVWLQSHGPAALVALS